MIHLRGYWKSDLDLVLVFHCDYTSIIHHFRFIQVFLLAGKDVIALSLLGGAVGDSSSLILEE